MKQVHDAKWRQVRPRNNYIFILCGRYLHSHSIRIVGLASGKLYNYQKAGKIILTHMGKLIIRNHNKIKQYETHVLGSLDVPDM